MGVQGLWDLVAPAGRKIKISTLEGKVLAIDVSIWLLRILHGHISVGTGEFSNVHLIGVLKRIIKLMFYGIKPVFVFDGKFPELKKETVHQRQMMREHKKRNLKKIAEKYLAKVLEQKIKETIRGIPNKQTNSNRDSDNFVAQIGNEGDESEDEHYFDDTEENKQERKQKKKAPKKKKENEEEEGSEKETDAMLYDYEFDIILEENKDLLIESGIDMEEFYKQDLSKQYNTIKKFRNNMRERKMKKYLSIDNLDEFSKVHIMDYVKNCKRKIQVEKNKVNDQMKKMSEAQENILGNVKFSDFASNNYMRNLFLDPRKNVMQKTLVSNRNKGFIYMERNEKRNENHMLKLGNKRQSKYERNKKLAQKLKEVAQNAENGHQHFTFEEILADNPLDAFKHHAQKGEVIPQKDSLNKSDLEDQSKNDISHQVDVNEVFGFEDWEETTKAPKSESLSDIKGENMDLTYKELDSKLIEEKDKNESNDEDLMGLFEYKIEEMENEIANKNEVEEEIQKDSRTLIKKVEKGNRIKNIARELEAREKYMQEIFTSTNETKGMKTEEMSSKTQDKKLFGFDPKEAYGNEQEEGGSKSSPESSPVKKVVHKVKKEIREIVMGNNVNKDVKNALFERIEARALNKANSLEDNKQLISTVEKEKSTFSLFNEQSNKHKLETPTYDNSFSISTKDTETKTNLTASQMFAERETIITKTVNKWLGLHDGKDSVATVKGKKTKANMETDSIETEKKIKKQEKFEESLSKADNFLKEPESALKEERKSAPSSPSFFIKAKVEDLYDPDTKADYFWEEPKRNSSSKKSVEEIIDKEQALKYEDKEDIGEIIEIQSQKHVQKPKKVAEKEENEEKEEKELKPIMEVPQEANQNSNGFSTSSQDNWEEMDEEALLAKMKELEEDDVTDKTNPLQWSLMEKFQQFQNLSELEGGSIQDKLREIKEMLIMFGIPWVDSPAEAEAQCSFLEMNGIVDGVITDDSDVFLFGARHVYRNMFDKGDYAHSFQMKSIEQELGLDRTKLILMALFLGSDYTLGIKGVGIVNAMEIVGAFETLESLERFKIWAELPDVFMDDPTSHYKNIPAKELQYKLNHRNYKKHWELPPNFPDQRVVTAYEKPLVDQSLEKFEWGTPDVDNIENVCKTRFKWDDDRVNNTLEPLRKAMKERRGQKRITDFFREEKFAQINSKRLNETIKGLQKKENSNDVVEFTEEVEKLVQRQNTNKLKRQATEEQNNQLNEFAFKKKKTKKALAI